MTVFGKPNFGDPTLFEKKHEVLGYYVLENDESINRSSFKETSITNRLHKTGKNINFHSGTSLKVP